MSSNVLTCKCHSVRLHSTWQICLSPVTDGFDTQPLNLQTIKANALTDAHTAVPTPTATTGNSNCYHVPTSNQQPQTNYITTATVAPHSKLKSS
jgi:hypothetical protein